MPHLTYAFERDVHFGLTKWLALQAGYTQQQAEAIATGDQRVDSGDIQFLGLEPMYSCFAKDAELAGEVERHHYPSAGKLPSPVDQRNVIAGGEVARKPFEALDKETENRASFLLFKLGEALHGVQDSWSHQGIPEAPPLLEGVAACDANLAWAHPHARGGWNSHKADLTYQWPADTLAMAKTSYELIQQYPAISGVKRTPKPWTAIAPSLDGFIRASTKAQKRKWFFDQSIFDVSFLEGITLPDGPDPFTQQWKAHKLPPLPGMDSTQHHLDPALLAFFNSFFSKWVTTDNFDAIAAEFGAPPPTAKAKTTKTAAKNTIPLAPMDKAELAARLRVWRIRDHGKVAEIAHTLPPLSAAQRNTLAAITKDPSTLARYDPPFDIFYPLTDPDPEPSALDGFLIKKATRSPEGNERVVATTKFRNAPYDTIVVLAEQVNGAWKIVSIGAMVDH